MRIWVYVEGKSDELGLKSLWNDWSKDLKEQNWSIRIIRMDGKYQYFELIGSRAASNLVADTNDLVIGLPDLYPNRLFSGTAYRHNDLKDIKNVQDNLVLAELKKTISKRKMQPYMDRFYGSALKHDLEMLLLAADIQLARRLKCSPSRIRNLASLPENRNQEKPPKKIISDLFREYSKSAYLETKDAPAILRDAELREVILDRQGRSKCPAFQEMLDWVGNKTGVPAY